MIENQSLKDLNSKYRVILADPPWNFKVWSKKGEGKSAQNHYDCMTMADIGNLPVNRLGMNDSLLFLWVTDPLLESQLNIMKRWGYEYKTVGFTWIKLNKRIRKPFKGLGYYTRSNPEMCLIGTKGSPGRPKNKSIDQVIMSPVREHSRKPDIIRKYIEQMYDGPYIELFSRETVPGWDAWGKETTKFNPLF